MSMEIQKQIKDNSRQMSDYFGDLVKWEEEETKKEARREAKGKGIRPDTAKKVMPPPRGSEGNDEEDGNEEPIARDKIPMPQYYHNWDQYDPDEEVDKLDIQEENKQRKAKELRQSEKDQILDDMAFKGDGDRVRTTKARPKVKINVRVKGRRPAPVDLAKPKKEEANNLFAAGRFKEAMVAYSTALEYLEKYLPPGEEREQNEAQPENVWGDAKVPSADGAGQETEALELKCTLLANRAQALIKIEEWQEAVWDCTEALRFNPEHHKAVLRRGFALAKMKRWSAAARDLERATVNDPQDRKAAAELQMARRNLAEQAKEVRTHAKAIICDTTRESAMPTRKLTVKVRQPGDTSVSTPDPEGPSSSPATASQTFQPQPRGARGENRAAVDLDGDGPLSAAGAATATVGEPAPRTRQPYVPRSVRIRGRQPDPEASPISEPSSAAASRGADASAPAVNFYAFESQWNRNARKPRERAAQLRRVGAEALPALFRESLDAELVGSIISVLSSELSSDAEGAVAFASSVLGNLSRTNRFEATFDALSVEERDVCREVLSALERQPGDCGEDVAALRRAFDPAPPAPRLPDQDDEDEDEDDVEQVYSAEQVKEATTLHEEALAAAAHVDHTLDEPVTAGTAMFSLDGCD